MNTRALHRPLARFSSLASLMALAAATACFSSPEAVPPGLGTAGASDDDDDSDDDDSDDDTTAGSSSDGGSDGTGGSTVGGDTTTDGDSTGVDTDSTDTGDRPSAGGTIIPLYTYPTDTTWATVAAAKQEHPEVGVVAIINPASGPGAAPDANYDTGITALRDAGVVVIGYVPTTYAARPLAEVEADVAAYASHYPQLDGVMFDEMSNVVGDEPYYAGLSGFATGLGLDFTVGNPGVGTPESFVDTVDTLFVYESTGLPDLRDLDGWLGAHDRENFAMIPHSVGTLDAGFVSAALGHVGWVYVTDDILPNPWDTLPPYFGQLVDQLAAG